MNNKMNVICPSCGAEFNKNLSQCPYCGNSNYYGQEKSYMKGLAGLRQRLAELADINKKIIRLQISPDWNYWQINSFKERGEKPPKYINFSSNGKKNGTKSGSMAGIHYDEPKFNTVIVTEGSKDAKIASEYLKRACIYLPGVDTYNAFLNSELFDELKKRGLKNIIIAYDADIIYKEQVKRAMEGFYKKLEVLNVNVYYAKWDIKNGKGIGDLILNGYKPTIIKRVRK